MRYTLANPALLTCITFMLIASCSTTNDPKMRPDRRAYAVFPENLDESLRAELKVEGVTIQGAASDSSQSDLEGQLNYVRMRHYRDVEAQYYSRDSQSQLLIMQALGVQPKSWPDGLPKLCLALSGGGMRSAAVSIGVLQEIEALNGHTLHGLDIVSGVSGGAYAASWPIAQVHNAGRVNGKWRLAIDDIVSDEKPYVRSVERNAKEFSDYAEVISTLGGLVWAEPFLVWQNFLPGYPVVDIGGIGYYVAIYNAFHSPPERSWLHISRTPLKDIESMTKEDVVPFTIINTTGIPTGKTCKRSFAAHDHLSNDAFEVTPIRIGSDGYGYSTQFESNDYWELTGAVMASGAALDESELWTCSALRPIGLLTGVKVISMVTSTMIAPAADSTSPTKSDVRATSLRFVDGASTDNLALYSLIKRGCQTILEVDATEDPDLKYERFKQLKSDIQKQFHLEIKVPGLEPSNEELNGSGPRCTTCGISAEHVQNPVMRGSVGPIPYLDKQLTPTIVYLKLSIDGSGALSETQTLYSHDVATYYQSHNWSSCAETKRKSVYCRFPQPTSRNQGYSEDMIRSLRKLGRDLIRNEFQHNGVTLPQDY